MGSRAELAAGLSRATEILQAAEHLQAEIAQDRERMPLLKQAAKEAMGKAGLALSKKPMKKHMGIVGTALIFFFCGLWIESITRKVIVDPIIRSMARLAGYALSLWVAITLRKIVNRSRDAENERRKAHNQAAEDKFNASQAEMQRQTDQQIEAIRANRSQLLARLEQVSAVYEQEVRPWLPNAYSYSQATGEMLALVQNGRADTLKEAINLYENILHQRRMEAGQRQIMENQRLQALQLQAGIESLRQEIASLPPPQVNVHQEWHYDHTTNVYM